MKNDLHNGFSMLELLTVVVLLLIPILIDPGIGTGIVLVVITVGMFVGIVRYCRKHLHPSIWQKK